MINSSSKNKKKKIVITLLVLGFFSFLIFFYKDSAPVSFFQGSVQSIFSAPKSLFYSLGKKEREDEVKKLKEQLAGLQQKMADYELIKRDNEALRSQFDENGETSLSLVSAKIIGFIGENTKPSELVINAGKKQGIVKGMTVVFQKFLIGKISDVSQNYSVVETIYNPKFQVLAKLPETNANGIVLGQNDLILFDGVLITDTLKKDGIVTTKGEVDKNGTGVIPDMIIGKVVSISKRETAPFQSAQLMPLIDYSKLTNIFIVKKM